MPVMATLPGIAQIRDAGAITVAEFDTYLPLLSLPRVFGTTPATFPVRCLTLTWPPCAAARTRRPCRHLSLSAQATSGSGVGGQPDLSHDRQRSCALQDFAPVLQTPGIEFYSLQKDDRSQELTQLPPNLRVEDLAPLLHDFGDTALLVDQLDLVITVDTALAHLGGCHGQAGVGAAESSARLALGAGGGDDAVVSDHAVVSADAGRRLVIGDAARG